MEEESQEIGWNEYEWERMVKEEFKTITTSLPPDVTLVTEDGNMFTSLSLSIKYLNINS